MIFRTLAILLFALPKLALAATLSHTIGPQDNLFFDTWGHPYTLEIDLEEPDLGGAGVGNAPPVVSDAGMPFNFAPFDVVDITATGLIVDINITATPPSGSQDPEFIFEFRELLVYSVIGIWSTTSNEITPIGLLNPHPAFNVGAAATISIPDVPTAFLFLSDNDGWFDDNTGSYDVTLHARVVPLPAPIFLLGFSLGLLGLYQKKLRNTLTSFNT